MNQSWKIFLRPNSLNLSHVSSPPKTGFNYLRRLKSWKIEYNFKWNQPYLSRVSNLNPASVLLRMEKLPGTRHVQAMLQLPSQ